VVVLTQLCPAVPRPVTTWEEHRGNEVGHWLDPFTPHGEDCDGLGDYDDTPKAVPTQGCPLESDASGNVIRNVM
jgi:hypothetical protein